MSAVIDDDPIGPITGHYHEMTLLVEGKTIIDENDGRCAQINGFSQILWLSGKLPALEAMFFPVDFQIYPQDTPCRGAVDFRNNLLGCHPVAFAGPLVPVINYGGEYGRAALVSFLFEKGDTEKNDTSLQRGASR